MNIKEYMLKVFTTVDEETEEVVLDKYARIRYYSDVDEFYMQIQCKGFIVHDTLLDEDTTLYYLNYYGRLD